MAYMKALQVVAEPIGVAKHVFSHVQWDMVGYRVKILCENNGNTEELLENISENEHFFPDVPLFSGRLWSTGSHVPGYHILLLKKYPGSAADGL